MRILVSFAMFGLLLAAAGCTTTPAGQKPKILCPACGTEFDSLYFKRF